MKDLATRWCVRWMSKYVYFEKYMYYESLKHRQMLLIKISKGEYGTKKMRIKIRQTTQVRDVGTRNVLGAGSSPQEHYAAISA